MQKLRVSYAVNDDRPTSYTIHIGQHKTGSSALQKFLQVNAKALKAKGIVCPMTGRIPDRAAQHYLAWGCRKPASEKYNLLVKIEDLYTQVVEEAEKSRASRIIISSEGFFAPEVDVEQVRNLLGENSVQILLFLRPADELLESYYNHHVRSRRAITLSIHDFAKTTPISRAVFERTDTIMKWIDVFGTDRIRFHRLDRSKPTSQLYEKLLITLGTEPSPDFTFPAEKVNAAVPRNALALLRMMNFYNLDKEQRNRAIQWSRELDENGMISDCAEILRPVLLTERERTEILSRAKEKESLLAQLLLGRESLFESR